MTTLTACHSPFLQSRASLLIIGLGTDGVVLNPTLSRLLQSHESIRTTYKDLAQKGELSLGDVQLFETQKQATGLGAGNNKMPDYIAIAIINTNPKDTIKPLTLKSTCQKLNPKLFDLMRYKHLRTVAIYAGNLLGVELPIALDEHGKPDLTAHKQAVAKRIWQIFQEGLDISRLAIEVHFDKSIDIERLA